MCAEIAAIPVVNKSDHSVTVGDLAVVDDGVAEAAGVARLNGQDAVLLTIRKQSGTNTVAMVDEVISRVEELKKSVPAGYRIDYTNDQSDYIRASTSAVKEHLVLGSILAAVVVLLFLRNWRSTVIAAIAIPTSVISTFALIWAMGYTLNEITLLALALCVGIVIDDAIVVLENIHRFIEQKGMPPFQAAREATAEIGLPVMVITLSLVAVFLPIAFMSGMVGRIMGAFGFTMTFAILISLVVSFTLTPTLSARWLKPHAAPRPSAAPTGRGVYGVVEAAYMVLLRWSMGHRWVVACLCLAALGSLPILLAIVPKNFMPEDDQSALSVTLRLQGGRVANGNASDGRPGRGRPEAHAGREVHPPPDWGRPGEAANEASIDVHLVDPGERTYDQREAVDFIRRHFLPRYASELVRSSVTGASGMGKGGGPSGVQYVISGPDLGRLIEYSGKMIDRLKSVPGIEDAQSSLELGKPEYGVIVDRERAADLGVSVSDIASTLRLLVAGEKVSDYAENGEQYDVVLRAAISSRSSLEGLSLVSVPSTKHGAVLLRDVVRYEPGSGPSQIDRISRQRQVTISCNIGIGHSQQELLDRIEQVARDMHMPPDYTTGLTGMSKELGKATASFLMAFLTAFIFMYLVIAAQFESWLHPLTILLSLPLTLPFALLSQIMFGESLNMFSALGMLVLFAVVKKNSILQIDHTIALRASGMPRLDAILEANRDRLRPILMTTIAFVAGMAPMLLASGAGSATTRTISSLIVGGQTLSLMLTLLATPVAYSLFDDMSGLGLPNRLARWVVLQARQVRRMFAREA